VTDSLGYSDQATGQVVVVSGCTALTSVDFTYLPTNPLIGGKVTFNATYLPANATAPITYDWDFGDGTVLPGGGASVEHTFTKAESFTVEVTASNACTVGVSTSKSVKVVLYVINLPLILR
jgi:PKD repeat protein